MMGTFFESIHILEDVLWNYLGVPAIVFVGIYLSFSSRFVQIRKLPTVFRIFYKMMSLEDDGKQGVHPLKAFFASVGGCVGIGNIVSVCTAIQIGGPGALLWLWITAILGVMLKYAEVYLGVLYRVPNKEGGYNGGPMYYLQRICKTQFIPMLVAGLLCVYGVEIWQFTIIVDSVTQNLVISPYPVIAILLLMVLFAGSGGVNRVGAISAVIIPVFLFLYAGMATWVVIQNFAKIPEVMEMVFISAFSGHAALGGFVGSTLMMTISQGVRRGCYTGDLGVGYTSVIHAETCLKRPETQASLVFVGIILDTFIICTASILIILLTGVWERDMSASLLIQEALGQYFPYMHFFMPLFLFMLGYSTINAYFCVGLKSADFISSKYGRRIYYIYATLALIIFSLIDSREAQSVMTVAGGFLLVINCWGIYNLRHDVSFDLGTDHALDKLSVCNDVL